MSFYLSPKKKFALILLLIHVIALPAISLVTYFILKDNAVKEAYNAARLHLVTIQSVKHYIADELRPIFYREMPGRFIVEGMSRSYIAMDVAGRVQKALPGYAYRNVSLNPKNPLNRADDFEAGIIRGFISNPSLKEWSGFRTRPEGEYFIVARPGEPFGEDCLRCHGDPATAPAELLERYGPSAGFHMKKGTMVDAALVYIPISLPLAGARKIVGVFIGLYILTGIIIFSVVQNRFNSLSDQTESDKQRIEEINLELMKISSDMEGIITERTMNLIALSIADRIRNPAAAIAGTFNRILRKETISEPLRERLTELLVETAKLDEIVRDYETILKSKQMLFKFEDLYEIVRSVLSLTEGERTKKGIMLSFEQPQTLQRCMANRQLLRVAVLQVLKNALEATPENGKIDIALFSDQDHVTISVTDSGQGIAADDMQKVFSPFYSTKQHSLGMGLALVKQIVSEHNGEIKIRSEQGKGTTVSLIFPVRWSEHELQKNLST